MPTASLHMMSGVSGAAADDDDVISGMGGVYGVCDDGGDEIWMSTS